MNDHSRNAAIWFSADGYDPSEKGINGRRVASRSFLRGFVKHAQVDEFVSFVQGKSSAAHFEKTLEEFGATGPARHVAFESLTQLPPVETVFYSAPTFSTELWRRYAAGSGAYSICGINHTISTKAVMQGMFDLLAGPLQPWDGIICTSESSKSAIVRHMEAIEGFFVDRFGKSAKRPQMPVIPLGIHCDEFAHDEAAAASVRSQFEIDPSDIVISTVARLEPYGKFDPFPLFMALEAAQKRLGDTCKLHFLACGYYTDGYSQRVFEDGARELMPNVRYHLYDGAKPGAPARALSASDIFTFPIDNFQETFGLAPIEAMAAGLPVVVTDWDGMKDTVTSDVGFRCPTRTLGDRHCMREVWHHFNFPGQTGEYGEMTAAMVEMDITAMTDAFVTLAESPDLRRRMGDAGKKRAETIYDWSNIVPQYQDFWAELSKIRQADAPDAPTEMQLSPVAPPPTWQFKEYPTSRIEDGVGACIALDHKIPIAEMFTLRRYDRSRSGPFEDPRSVETIYQRVRASGTQGMSSIELAQDLKTHQIRVDRILMWLMKYQYVKLKAAG